MGDFLKQDTEALVLANAIEELALKAVVLCHGNREQAMDALGGAFAFTVGLAGEDLEDHTALLPIHFDNGRKVGARARGEM